MSTDEVKNDESIEDYGTWTTIPKKKKRDVGVGEVTEDHPVIKKILDYIEKVIKPIDDDVMRHDKFASFIGRLPEKELVIYGVYMRISLIPGIYNYDSKVGLSYNELRRLGNILEYGYLDNV